MLVKTRSAFAPNMIHQCWLSKRARSREGVNLRVVWVGLGCRSCTSDPREFASDRYRRKIWTLGTQYLTQIWPKVAISIWTESDDTQWPVLLLLLLLYKGDRVWATLAAAVVVVTSLQADGGVQMI